MKRRLLPLALIAAMVLTIAASAEDAPSFPRTREYTGQFSDLTEDSVFYENVRALYEYGLSVGKTDGSFGLKDPVSVSQVLIFAGRIRSLYEFGDPEAGAAAFAQEDQPVGQPYLRYLQSLGILADEWDDCLYTPATRAQVAHVLANTLPEDALPPIHEELVAQAYASRRFIPDVTEYTEYYPDILALYRKGISIGSDAHGSFHPESNISRGALSAMLTRMADPLLRVTPQWDLSALFSAEGRGYASLIFTETAYIAAPYQQEEIAQAIAHMLYQESNILSLDYGTPITGHFAARMMEQALVEVKSYCEQSYNYVSCTYSPEDGKMRLTFSSASCTNEQLQSFRQSALEAAIAVHDQLWAEGLINASMSEYEKARVYFDWICQNCTYDYAADDSSLSHIAYAVFHTGTAVCDGYTGAYNLLLKLEGIECRAHGNAHHIWTIATLDGVQYHIDTTWGDANDALIDDSLFAMSAEEAWARHSW